MILISPLLTPLPVTFEYFAPSLIMELTAIDSKTLNCEQILKQLESSSEALSTTNAEQPFLGLYTQSHGKLQNDSRNT